MLRPQAEQCVHGGLPVLAWGTRDAEDDVHIHVGKPGLPRRGRRRLGVCSAVPATEGFEVSVVERLHAKAETVATLPTFRDAYARRRCIVPVDGFFEWKPIKGQKAKQPFAIAMKDGSPFGIAGLWENWKDRSGTNGSGRS